MPSSCILCGEYLGNKRRNRHPICQKAYRNAYSRLYNRYYDNAIRDGREISEDEREQLRMDATEAARDSEQVRNLAEELRRRYSGDGLERERRESKKWADNIKQALGED